MNWKPVTSATEGQLQINGFSIPAFTSDYRLRFRLKLKSQPPKGTPPSAPGCTGVVTGTESYPWYTKAKFKMKFHTWNGSSLQVFQTIDVDPIDVNGCSPIYTLAQAGIGASHTFNNPNTTGPIFVSIENVETNYNCLTKIQAGYKPGDYYYDYYCPLKNSPARSQSCWNMVLQVVNDSTDDFK
jgi:hypothetical protein